MGGFRMSNKKEGASVSAQKRVRLIAAICIAALMAFGALGLAGCSCSNTSAKTDDDNNVKKEQVSDKKDPTKTVPNVVGMTKDDAERVIKDAGFAVGTETEEASETVVAGAVISQSVKAKSEAKAGSSIGITVSKGSGKPAKRVSVPSLIGMTQTQAEDVLASLKLVSKAEDPVYSEDAKPGTIFKQSVAAGTEVEEGSTVSFTAALGKDFAIVPRVIGLERDRRQGHVPESQRRRSVRQRHEGDHYPLEGSRSRAYRAGGRAECGNSDTGTGARRVGKRRAGMQVRRGGRGHGRRAEHCGRHQGRSRVDGDRQARDSSHRFGGRAGCLTSCSYKSATRGRANG